MISFVGAHCGRDICRRQVSMKRVFTLARAPAGMVPAGMARVGIGTPGLESGRFFRLTESFTAHSVGASTLRFSSIGLLSSTTVTGATNLTILGISMRRMDTVSSRPVDFTAEVSEAVPVCIAELVADGSGVRKGPRTGPFLTSLCKTSLEMRRHQFSRGEDAENVPSEIRFNVGDYLVRQFFTVCAGKATSGHGDARRHAGNSGPRDVSRIFQRLSWSGWQGQRPGSIGIEEQASGFNTAKQDKRRKVPVGQSRECNSD